MATRRSSLSARRDDWRPNAALVAALNPSTSKEHVLPRLDNALFAKYRFVNETGHLENSSLVLQNYLQLEKCSIYRPIENYFECAQIEVTVHMRTVLVQWMREVCEEEKCSCEVFPLAVSYLDRFLSVESVHKKQLQALGVSCIFLASKIKEPRPFTASRLIEYTDDAVSISELMSWELLVLNRLNWDLASLTAFDFLDQYLHLGDIPVHTMSIIRHTLEDLVAKCYTDFKLAVQLPSEIAKHALSILLEKKQSQLQE